MKTMTWTHRNINIESTNSYAMKDKVYFPSCYTWSIILSNFHPSCCHRKDKFLSTASGPRDRRFLKWRSVSHLTKRYPSFFEKSQKQVGSCLLHEYGLSARALGSGLITMWLSWGKDPKKPWQQGALTHPRSSSARKRRYTTRRFTSSIDRGVKWIGPSLPFVPSAGAAAHISLVFRHY